MVRTQNLMMTVNLDFTVGPYSRIQQNSIQIVEPIGSFATCQGGPQGSQEGAVADDRDRLSFPDPSREMSQKPPHVWTRICDACWSVLWYGAVLCKMRKRTGSPQEDKSGSLAGSAETGGVDMTAIDVKPVILEAVPDSRPITQSDPPALDGEPRISEPLTDRDSLWI
jgi:hypothetical protein